MKIVFTEEIKAAGKVRDKGEVLEVSDQAGNIYKKAKKAKEAK